MLVTSLGGNCPQYIGGVHLNPLCWGVYWPWCMLSFLFPSSDFPLTSAFPYTIHLSATFGSWHPVNILNTGALGGLSPLWAGLLTHQPENSHAALSPPSGVLILQPSAWLVWIWGKKSLCTWGRISQAFTELINQSKFPFSPWCGEMEPFAVLFSCGAVKEGSALLLLAAAAPWCVELKHGRPLLQEPSGGLRKLSLSQ